MERRNLVLLLQYPISQNQVCFGYAAMCLFMLSSKTPAFFLMSDIIRNGNGSKYFFYTSSGA